MKQFIATLASSAPYFQSRSYEREVPKLPKEGPDDYENRTWKNRAHTNQDGNIVIPGICLQFSIAGGAKYMNEKIKGSGNATWTKHFASGLLISDDITLPETRDDIQGQWLHLSPTGKPGSVGGTRVWKCMPFVQQWQGDLTIHVLDDLITDDILRRAIEQAGQFIGIGQNRPENRGRSGRYQLLELVAASMPEPSVRRAA